LPFHIRAYHFDATASSRITGGPDEVGRERPSRP
jgi:hypothetical protein